MRSHPVKSAAQCSAYRALTPVAGNAPRSREHLASESRKAWILRLLRTALLLDVLPSATDTQSMLGEQ